jgi:hypothetical protein
MMCQLIRPCILLVVWYHSLTMSTSCILLARLTPFACCFYFSFALDLASPSATVSALQLARSCPFILYPLHTSINLLCCSFVHALPPWALADAMMLGDGGNNEGDRKRTEC